MRWPGEIWPGTRTQTVHQCVLQCVPLTTLMALDGYGDARRQWNWICLVNWRKLNWTRHTWSFLKTDTTIFLMTNISSVHVSTHYMVGVLLPALFVSVFTPTVRHWGTDWHWHTAQHNNNHSQSGVQCSIVRGSSGHVCSIHQISKTWVEIQFL